MRRTRRHVTAKGLIRATFGLCGLIAAVVLVTSGVGFSFLASGPVSLERLKPQIVASLEERLGGKYRVAIGPASLMNGPHGLGVGFGGIEIRDLQGRAVVRAPSGRVGLDVLALLTLDIKVRRLELDGLDVKLRVRRDGGLSVAAVADDSAAPIELGRTPASAPAVDFGLVLAGLVEGVAGARQALDHVSLVKGRLEVVNEALGVSSVYNDLTLAFDRSGQTADVSMSAQGPSGKLSIAAKASDGASRVLSVEAHDLALDDFVRLDAHRPPVESDMPISFKFDTAVAPDGAMQRLNGAFSLGAGVIKLDDPDAEPFLADEATGKVAWDPTAKVYEIKNVEVLSGATHLRIAGGITPPGATDPNWRVSLGSKDIVFDGERPGERPVTIDDAIVEAHFTPAEQRFTLDKLSVHGPHLQGSMTAEVTGVEGGATIKLGLDVGPSAMSDIMRIWPSNINPDGRNWAIQNLRGGELASGAIKLDWDAAATAAAFAKQALPAESIHGEFVMRDATVQLLPGLPVATGVDVAGVLTGRTFSITGKHGVMDLGAGRRLTGSDIYFKIPDTSPATIVASEGGARLTGGADALADLLGREPIKRFAGATPDAASVRGQFQGQLTLFLGLGKSVKPEDQKFRAEGTLSNLSVEKFMGNEKIEQGALDMTADSQGFKLAGQALVNGIPAKFEFAKSGAEDGALTMNMTLDDAARAKLGLTSGAKITGPMAVRVRAPLNKSGADFEVDLAKVAIESPDGASLKSAGRPGKATFTMKTSPEGMAISAIALDAGPLLMRGSLNLAADGALQNAKLTQLRLTAGDELKVDLTGGSVMKAVVRGASLDARTILKGLLGGEKAGGEAHDLDLDIKLASVGGFNHEAISQFDLTAVRRAGAFKNLELRGRIGQGTLVARGGETAGLNVHAEDAGALAKFLDIYAKLEGGALELQLQLRGSADGAHGTATIKRFAVRNESALKQLSASAPPTNSFRDEGHGAAADGDIVRFDRLSVNFTRNASRLELRDGVIFNPAFGLTTSGFLDYTHDKMDLSGVFVPAYSLNSALNHIPVVGLLLSGGGNEGVFAVNYRISGLASSPTLNVNPLSGMTPGILRKLFGAFDGTSPPPASSYAPVDPDQ